MSSLRQIQVEGQKEFIKSLRAVSEDLPKELTQLHKAVAEPVADAARSRAPSSSGRLAGSIRAQGGQRYARVSAGRKSIPYAGPIHFGWPARNIEPQPFLTDTLEAESENMLDHYHQLLEAFLDRVWKSKF